MIKLKFFRETAGLCGPACLKMVFEYYGVLVSESKIARASGASKKGGVSISGLVKASRYFGFKAVPRQKSTLRDLRYLVKKRKIPVIVDWFDEDDGHYSVVVDINKKNVVLIDPGFKKGARKFSIDKFLRIWFDFPGTYIKNPKDLILRAMVIITPDSAFG